jgi:hypothetical protein
MVEARWLRWFGPGVVALGAVGLVGSAALGAATHVQTRQACAGSPTERNAAAHRAVAMDLADLRSAPWFRLDARLDRDGLLAGQTLTLGLDGESGGRVSELPAESFAAGPFGQVVLVGADDGNVSSLQALDIATGCTWPIATERSVIRRATIDPTGTTVFEMRVDRVTRADLGIWSRPMDGHLPVRQVLPAPAADGRFGRTWSTEFAWDLEGDKLAVQSCGEVACRTRVIDPGGGPIVLLDAPDLGALVGFDGNRLVSYAACRGLPCPIVSTDLATGHRVTLASTAGPAVVVATTDGARLVDESPTASRRDLRSVALDGGAPTNVGPIPDGLALVPGPVLAGSATRLPAGWVLLAPAGRLPLDGRSGDTRLRHIPDGATVPLAEAAR